MSHSMLYQEKHYQALEKFWPLTVISVLNSYFVLSGVKRPRLTVMCTKEKRVIASYLVSYDLQPVSSLRRSQGGRSPLPTACVPPFRFTQNTFFGTPRNGKITDSIGKRNNNVQT